MPPRDALKVHLGLALVTLFLFLHPLFLGETWFQRDALELHQSYRAHVLASLGAGRVPEWWDAVGLGVPVAGNPLFGVGYPVMWLLAALPSTFAVDLLFALHVFWAGVGVARLAARWGAAPLGAFVGGASFAAGGYVLSMIVMGIPLLTLAWTPHVVVAVEAVIAAAPGRARVRAGLWLAATFALQLTSGDPAGVITSGLLVLVVVVVRARPRLPALAHVAAWTAAALPLAAVMILPALGFLADSPRQGGLPADEASVWSMHPARAIEMIWPHAFGETTDPWFHIGRLFADAGGRGHLQPAFAPVIYVGLPVLLLAAYAAWPRDRDDRRLAWILATATVLFGLLALGEYTPVYAIFRAVFLPEWIVRYPERHIAGALVVWSALAGVGFTRAFAAAAAPSRRLVVGLGGGVATLAVGVVAVRLLRGTIVGALGDLAWQGRRLALPPPVRVDDAIGIALASGQAASVTLALVTAAVVARGSTRLPRVAGLAPALAAVVIVGHLVLENVSAAPTLPRAVLLDAPAWLVPALAGDRAAAAAGAPRARVYRDSDVVGVPGTATPFDLAVQTHDSLGDHTAPRYQLAEVPGYDPTVPPRAEALWRRARGAPFERLLDLLDVKWTLLPADDARGARLETHAAGAGRYRLLENPGRRPRAFVAARWQWVADPEAALAALLAPELDFQAVRLEGSGEPPPPSTAAIVPCDVRTPRPERIEVTCPASEGGYLVLLDAWSPGWSARVDGGSAAIVRAESLVRAVRVPPGPHVVTMAYAAPGLRAGAAIAAAAWLAWLAALLYLRRRRA